MDLSSLIYEVDDYFIREKQPNGQLIPAYPDLFLFKESHQAGCISGTYDIGFCLILQGSKELRLSDGEMVKIKAGESFIVTHTMPVVSYVINGGPTLPYLGLVFSIDIGVLYELYPPLSETISKFKSPHSQAMSIGRADDMLIDALTRYLKILKTPQEVAVLAPLIRKEIHFRLLTATHGATLRSLLTHDSHASRVMQATNYIREHFNNSLTVSDVARIAGMSEPSFYNHFKSIMGISPLQYQKELRLTEAHKRLHDSESSVTSVAFSVGYESPTQFSREFSRKYGVTPKRLQKTVINE